MRLLALARRVPGLRPTRTTGSTDGTSFCDGCGEVCTPACRSAARRDRDLTATLRRALPR